MVDQNLPYRFLRGQPLKYGQAGYPTSAGYLTYLGSPIPMSTGPYYSVVYKFATYLQGAFFFRPVE